MNAAQVQLSPALNAPVQASSRARPDARQASLDFKAIKDSAVRALDKGHKDAQEEKPAEASAEDTELAAASTGALMQPAAQPVQMATAGGADEGTTQIQPEISTCCSMPETIGKIADILEGFGLLKEDGSTQIAQKGLQFLSELAKQMQSGTKAADTNAVNMATVTGNEAGMLKTTNPDEMQQLQGLIKEYFCSLENEGKTASTASATGGPQLVTDPLPVNTDGNAAASITAFPNAAPAEAVSTTAPSAAAAPAAAAPAGDTSAGDAPAANASDEAAAVAGTSKGPRQDTLGQLIKALHQAFRETAGNGADSAAKSDTSSGRQDTQVSTNTTQPTAYFKVHGAAVVETAETSGKGMATGKDMAENIQNIVERMTYHSGKDEQEFSVSLKPAHLGELSIKLVKSGDGMLAQIKAADAATKGLIQNELNTLADQLKEKGVSLSRIEVTYEAPSFSFNPQQSNAQKQNSEAHQSGRAKRYRSVSAVDAYEAAAPSAAQALPYAANSSVEFQA